jgi:thiamine pyridinylase
MAPSAETAPTAASDELRTRVPLRVSLYPWIPEPEAFFAWVKSDFEAKNPDIELVVRALEKSFDWEPGFVADLAYETDKAIAALNDPSDPDAQDLVEIDTLTLGTLARSHAIVPFRTRGQDFLLAADEAVRWQNQSFGVPHWTCGYFIISEDPAIQRARNARELVATLEAEHTDRVDLAGTMDGSWDSISVYLDALHDTFPNRDTQAALTQPQLDPVVLGQLETLRPACTKDGVNYCGGDAVDLFATGGADALFGFSERLNPILAHPDKTVGTLHIASATLGGGDQPLAFVDALVKSPQCTSQRCRDAAQRFADYYVSDRTFEASMMDTPSGVPRYLLPSTSSSLEFGRVGRDRLYGELKREIKRAHALPNSGVPEARAAGTIRPQVQAALGL